MEERKMEKAKWVNTIPSFPSGVLKLCLMVEAKMVILSDVLKYRGNIYDNYTVNGEQSDI